MVQPTVITAYYPIRSKHPVDRYIEWIRDFWPNISCPLVFFTSPELVPFFGNMFEGRKSTLVIGLPFAELAAVQKLDPQIWEQTAQLDHETGHSPELYAIWYEKKEFVLRVAEKNPFGSDSFVWCDAGICRFKEWLPHLKEFPRRDMVPSGKMLVLRINPFEGVVEDGVPGRFEKMITVGGGILAGDASSWISWSKAYDEMLVKYVQAGRFIGKDQNIMASMILDRPDLVIMIDPPGVLDSIQLWFYLLFVLAGVHIV